MPFDPILAQQDGVVPVATLVQELVQYYIRLWYACEREFPSFQGVFTAGEQNAKEKELDRLIDGLIYELKHMPVTVEGKQAQLERLKIPAQAFACKVLNLEQRHLEFIEDSGMLSASQKFARMARAFDPQLSAEDIYQASRNVMTMNFLQILLDLPVEVTPSIFAYSMLYPYTDNYLDDPQVSQATKQAFNQRFQHRLEGEAVPFTNPAEAAISNLVGMIEEQWDRARYPEVYESLLAIHIAQVKSLGMISPSASPFELDVLGTSFEKGGTSVLADGYLVAGRISPDQARLMFGYGAFTQLMDDLEDVPTDGQAGQLTIFTQTAPHWPLDTLTNRLFHFGRAIFQDLSAFPAPASATLQELMERSVDPILIDSAGRIGSLYSKPYLQRLEEHFPFRFARLHKQRKKLDRQKINLERLIETFILQPEI